MFDTENLRLFILVNRARRHCRELSSACARVVAMDFCVVAFRRAALCKNQIFNSKLSKLTISINSRLCDGNKNP